MTITKSILLFFFSMLIFQGCKTTQSVSSKVVLSDGKTIAKYLKTLQYTKDGKHLFGHESTTMMGVGGEKDWYLKDRSEVGQTISEQKSDVKDLVGQLPAITGYDAFKLILDVTDGLHRMEEVETSLKALKMYRENGGLIAFDWHIQPIFLPSYRERAYRMDEVDNKPFAELMKKEQPFYRIANGFETKDKWWMEFETKRLKPMSERLKRISADGSGIIFRPFHEADGDWFWWGIPHLQGAKSLNGKEALMKVFVETARYFKRELPEILIAFSTDKLEYVSHEKAKDEEEIVCRYRDEFATYLPKNSTDLALIDIYGMDLYTSKDMPSESLNRFKIKLQGLSLLAKEHDKIAAITEAGNRGLPSEDDARQPSINYFNNYLFKWITAKNVHVAYAVIWQNWSNNRDRKAVDPDDGYFTPINKNSDSGKDFIKYVEKQQSIMLEEFQTEIKRYKKK